MSEKLRPNFENPPAVAKAETGSEVQGYQETIRELQDRLEKLRTEAEIRVESLSDQAARLQEAGIESRERETNHESLKPRKKVISFVGLPGAGKTTQIGEIQNATGAETFHLAKIAGVLHLERTENKEEVQQLFDQKKRKGELLDGLDELYLSEVTKDSGSYAILDGFPRSVQQAEKLFETADREQWDVQVIHLTFPEGKEVEESFKRQTERAKKTKSQDDQLRFFGKITRAISQDMSAIQAVRRIGSKISELDCTKSPEEITAEIRKELGLDFESLPWEREVLEVGETVSQQTGVELYFGAGTLYRPFWNGKFGPHQESTDKDVFVYDQKDIAKVREALEAEAPHIRWAVHSRVEESEKHFGKKPESLEDGILNAPINFRRGGVRMQDGKLEVLLAPKIEADLRNGIIRLEDDILQSIPEEQRDEYISGALSRIRKSIEEYPGLRLEGRLAELYAAKYGEHKPASILTTWEEMQEEVWEQEHGGKSVWRAELFTDKERAAAEDIRDFYRTADKKASPPPRPKKSALPGILEGVRLAKEKAEKGVALTEEERLTLAEKIQPPEGFRSWLEYATLEANDATFREWFLNQVRSRNPIGGRDAELRDILEFAKNEENKKITDDDAEQKVTHMGFRLHKHLEETALQLETDHLAEFLEKNGLNPEEAKHFRQQMRMAMICHDLGKLLNVNTPGSHEGIGAKMWLKLKPSWVSEDDTKIISWMIRSHDLFGRLARGITEKEGVKLTDPDFDVTAMTTYKGALDPEAVRSELEKSGLPPRVALAIHTAIWKADVSSVSSLRWILPVAEKLEAMIASKE